MKPFKILIVPMLLVACMVMTGCSDSDSPTAPPTVDTAPPTVPTGLQSWVCDSVIKLTWDPNNVDTDFKGYLVYRMDLDEIWTLTNTPITSNVFVDRAPLPGPCTYAVTAVDNDDNESAWRIVVLYDVPVELNFHKP